MKAATRNPNRGRNGSTSWIAKSTRYAIYHRDGWRCVYCRFVVSSKSATLDHLKPESKGGTHAATNLVTACGRCNSSRSSKPVATFLRDSFPVFGINGIRVVASECAAIRRRSLRPLDREVGRMLARCFYKGTR